MAEIYQTINSLVDNKLIVFILSGIMGFLINVTYSFYGFKWLDNINQKIISLIMAPAMTVIAWTIAGNLGLSLGMIGALSIVRFRTPIKSSLELIIYFIFIVIGISITVAPIYTVLIFMLTILTPLIFILNRKNKNLNLEYIDTYAKENSTANFIIGGKDIDENILSNSHLENIIHLRSEENGSGIQLTVKVKDLNDFNMIKKTLEEKTNLISCEFIS